MTMNDVEWLEWPFYVKFSLLRTDFESCYLLTYCRVYLHIHVTNGDVRQRSSGSCSAEYLKSTEELQIFRRRYIVGTLTNKANISI